MKLMRYNRRGEQKNKFVGKCQARKAEEDRKIYEKNLTRKTCPKLNQFGQQIISATSNLLKNQIAERTGES